MRERLLDWAIVLATFGGLVLLVRGCPGPDRPLDPAQIARVQEGMSEAEVLEILGPPSEPLDLADLGRALGAELGGYRWRSGGRKVEVYLIDGRVSGTVVVGY
ncbi:MAG TPA: hypothetical protein VIL46_07945 [Gemmataceae bacterium]